ncbi:MAG: T9SS type A sorting domain-containing protein [bacterium]
MRNLVCLALLVPAVLLAAGINQPVTAIAPEQPAVAPAIERAPARPAGGAFDIVGTLDTIGGTIYDWGFNGPGYRMLITSPDYGVHACWMFSNNPDYSDRNQRYNFYDFATRQWNWIDPDLMASGISVYSAKSGFGGLSTDPVTGVAVVSTHQGAIYPVVARDVAPGAGIFEYCSGQPNLDLYLWPAIDVSQSQTIHLAVNDDGSRDGLFYSRATTWCTWDVPIAVPDPQPIPHFPTQAIAASKVSNKVHITWVDGDDALIVNPAYFRESQDDGATWGQSTEITTPNPFGTDTTPSFHITGVFPWYDSQDNLHYVTNVMPVVRDTGYILPAVIYHWSVATGWVQIHRADTDSLLAAVGYNAMFACRPQIAQVRDDANKLHVVWEQFDGTNVEPVTNLVRADIYHSYSADGGATWTSALKLTDRTTVSNRFPSIADPVVDDTVMVLYEQDLQAGFVIQGQGTATNNPFVVQKIHYPSGPGVVENPGAVPTRTELGATPNPVTSRARISYALPRAGTVSLQVFDAAGRPVQTLVDGRVGAGRYTATWDASTVAGGVYFYTLTTDETSVTKKLIVTR